MNEVSSIGLVSSKSADTTVSKVVNFRASSKNSKTEYDSFEKEREKARKDAKRQQYFTNTVFGIMAATGIATLAILGHQAGWFKRFKLDFVDLSKQKNLKDMAMPESQKKAAEGIKNYINNYDILRKKGAKEGTAILMYGPPGTGKNTFAYAIAKEFEGAKFVDMDVSKMNSMWHGESEKNILGTMKAVIKYAQKHRNEKIFVFIDEIDSVMMKDSGNGAKLSQDILNAFKKGFNGLTKEKNVYVIGATNLHIDPKLAKIDGKVLDTAMLDRFSQKILVDLPDKEQIKIALTTFYKSPERGFIDASMTDINNPTLDKIATFLEKRTSFRTLIESLCDQTSKQTPIDKNVTYKDFINVIKDNQTNLNITDEEMAEFLKSVKL